MWPGLLLFGLWGVWMIYGTIDVYASAPHARLEVKRSTSRVAALVGGRVVHLEVALGDAVHAGDLLLALDRSEVEAELNLVRSELEVHRSREEAIATQLQREQAKRTARLRMERVARERAEIAERKARVIASRRKRQAQTARMLAQQQLAPQRDAFDAEDLRVESEVLVQGAALEATHLKAQHDYQERSHQTRMAELQRQLSDVRAAAKVGQATIQTVVAKLPRHEVRAPVDGRIEQIAPAALGDVIAAGDLIATIVPQDDVRIVAHFPAEDAIGRIAPGQAARLRLHGFSWLRFGMLRAVVSRTGREANNGSVRVELLPSSQKASLIPLQHGLTGAVDVRVAVRSPWALVLGKLAETALPSSVRPERGAWTRANVGSSEGEAVARGGR